ncbi:ATP-grasp domain-containing protein [Brenneria goodwinii]|uniref:ATP-grasp domain-containing protein n=1 Tax=Brenneria goodwinii TaxID=1109412 RepID=UPI0036F407E3
MIHDMHYQACKDVYLVDKFEAKEVTEIASQIHSKSPVDYVFSFIEEGLYPAAYLAKELKIEGMNYDVHRLCLDKTIMREKFKNTKFSISYLKTKSKNQAFYFFREHKRIVIKDPSGCGSENVYICNTDEEFSYAWLKTANLKNEIRLLEEFLDGREYSLETLSLNGHHNFIGATKTFLYPGHLAEQKHIFPAPDVTQEEYTMLEQFCHELLNEIGYNHGPCHIEARITKNGIKLIEINNRTAGDFIWQLVKCATGVDMLTETIKGAFIPKHVIPEYSSLQNNNTFASFVLYDPVDTNMLSARVNDLMNISTLYCEEGTDIDEEKKELNSNDILGFLVGEKKVSLSLNEWVSEIEKIIKESTFAKEINSGDINE